MTEAVDQRARIRYESIDDLVEWPHNPKDHDLEELKRSFLRFGFVQPILVDETSGRIVAGHGRVQALISWRDEDGRDPPARVVLRGRRLACEQTGRVCYAMDVEPRYVDVARSRYAALTGKKRYAP